METPAVYTVTQVAELLACDPRTVRNMIHRGVLRAVRVGRDWRVTRDSVDAFLIGSQVLPDGRLLASAVQEYLAKATPTPTPTRAKAKAKAPRKAKSGKRGR